MMAPTHRLGGLAAGMAAMGILGPDTYLEAGLLLGGAVLGSLLPDIDNGRSSISRRWSVVSLLVSLGQAFIRGLSGLLPGKPRGYVRSLIGHRGITHSLAAVALTAGLIVFVGHDFQVESVSCYTALGIGAGMLSHLLLDMLAGGIPLFMPFSVKRIRLGGLKTGGAGEWAFRGALVIVLVWLIGREALSWQGLLPV